MDVDRVSFYPLLVDILQDLSRAHFVAFDLELSGVPVKQPRAGQRPGKPTLQERYAETKAAAEKFHILQFGLTCVEEDIKLGQYVCKPYNFEISPLIDDIGLGIEREFTFSTGAVTFLHSVSFDFNKPFNIGIQYLTKEESKQARENFDARQKKDAVADMNIKDTDVQALALLKSTRRSVDSWLKKPSDFLNIGPEGFEPVSSAPSPEFNRFEKRLIHQLIRAEYPMLVSYSKRGFIQITRLDEQREARILAERKADNTSRVQRLKGFRWLIEALLGHDISSFDLSFCASDPITGHLVNLDEQALQSRFTSAVYRLRGRPRVMVGHNCFLDLVYIYHTFVGPLPDTVEQFKTALHEQWPVIIDTKYMATHNCGDINPASSLEELARQLQPMLGEDSLDTVDEEHSKYVEVDHYHEAGFDSLLTAQVAIRLSRKLEKAGASLQDVENDAGGVSIGGQGSSIIAKSKDALSAALSTLGISENSKPGFTPSDPKAQWTKTGEPTLKPQSDDDIFKFTPGLKYLPYEPTEAELKGIADGMPRFNSDFWRVYGNHLRIFGTEESLLALRTTDDSKVLVSYH